MTTTAAPPVAETLHRMAESPVTAVGFIWVSITLSSVFAPDLVTGSQQEHLPLALMTSWLWACVGSTYAVMTPAHASRTAWTAGVALIWLLAATVAVTAPVMVTGTDPTRIPLAVLAAPPVAAVVTGMLSLHHANVALDTMAATTTRLASQLVAERDTPWKT